MKLDQIAYAVYDDEEESRLKRALGLADKEWIRDYVIAESVVHFPDTGRQLKIERQTAILQFNYDLGIELEILRYTNMHESFNILSPMAWMNGGESLFISHQGFHLEEGEDFPTMDGFPLVQETWTKSHTSDFLNNPQSRGYGRTYHYRIHQLSPGTVVKFIKRIEPK